MTFSLSPKSSITRYLDPLSTIYKVAFDGSTLIAITCARVFVSAVRSSEGNDKLAAGNGDHAASLYLYLIRRRILSKGRGRWLCVVFKRFKTLLKPDQCSSQFLIQPSQPPLPTPGPQQSVVLATYSYPKADRKVHIPCYQVLSAKRPYLV